MFPNWGDEVQAYGTTWGMHGEVWTTPFDVTLLDDGAEPTARLNRVPVDISRRFQLEGGCLTITERLHNQGRWPIDGVYGHHPAFAPRIRRGGQTHLCGKRGRRRRPLSDGRRRPRGGGTGSVAARARSPRPHPRPSRHPDRRGQPCERMAYLTGVTEGRAGIASARHALTARLRWDADVFPNAWLWTEYHGSPGFPWFGAVDVIAVEPCTGYSAQGRDVIGERSGFAAARSRPGTHHDDQPRRAGAAVMETSSPESTTAGIASGRIDRPGDLGRLRRLDRCATEDGFLAVAAVDHPTVLLASSDGVRPSGREAAQLKLKVIRALAPHASGFLLDPELSIAQATVSGALPGSVGMIANIERMRETEDGFERTVDLRPDWTPDRIAASGADGAKFVFFHRAEGPEAHSDVQRVSELVANCHAVGLPCIIEPLWYPLEGEDIGDSAVRRARAEAIVEAAARFADCGADVMKVQFPGGVGDAAARSDAAATAKDLDAALGVPWVLLSEGVGYDDFAVQLELSAAAGASGFMAGRAVWKEAVASSGADAAVALATERLDKLTAIIRQDGRPWRELVSGDEVDGALAPSWWTAAV